MFDEQNNKCISEAMLALKLGFLTLAAHRNHLGSFSQYLRLGPFRLSELASLGEGLRATVPTEAADGKASIGRAASRAEGWEAPAPQSLVPFPLSQGHDTCLGIQGTWSRWGWAAALPFSYKPVLPRSQTEVAGEVMGG